MASTGYFPSGQAAAALAVRAAPLGATIVVGAGRYEAPPFWAPDVSLRGRCVRDTRLVQVERPDQRAMLLLQAVSTMPLRIENVGFDGDSPSLIRRHTVLPAISKQPRDGI